MPLRGGTVFKIAASTHALTTLVSFGGSIGENPVGGLMADAAGNLYGTTRGGGSGGVGDSGTAFRIAIDTGHLTTLLTFDDATGIHPQGALIADSVGNLYGTAQTAGENGQGTVYQISGADFVVPEPTAPAVVALAALPLLLRRRVPRPRHRNA